MLRRLMPAAALLAVVLAACGGPSASAINDPAEIIRQGLEATADATSFHLDLTVTGNITIPDTGGTFDLEGTTAAGDFDVANKVGRLTFEVPAIFSLSGEVLQIGADSYVKTSLTGDTYTKTTSDTGEVPTNPDKALAGLQDFLDKDGVETEKLADVSCGDHTCYAVTLTIPATLLSQGAQVAGIDPSELVGDALVLNMQFDRENLHLSQLSTDIDAGDTGSLGLLVTVSGYGDPVEVSPPPSEQVTEGTPQLPF